MTVKNIQHKAPYIANTFNNKDYLGWGYDDSTISGGRISGLTIEYTGGRYLAQPGVWISRGSYGASDNAGVIVDQVDAIEIIPVSAGSASSYPHVFYGYVDNATGSGDIYYGVFPSGSVSIPSGSSILATGTSNASGIVTTWDAERVVGIAGHVYAPVGSAHTAKQISYDNSIKNWAGNPNNVQDAIDLIPSKISFPSEIGWYEVDKPDGLIATQNVPFDPTPSTYPSYWSPSANKTIALVAETYIPGGLVTEFIRVQGQLTARAVTGISNGYTKWGVSVEFQDDLTGANGVFHTAETEPLPGSGGDIEWGTCNFNFLSTFSGSANLRKIARPICGYQVIGSARNVITLSDGPNITVTDRASTFIPGSEKIFWRNPGTLEWDMLTRDKDYSISSVGVVTTERSIAGTIYYTYRVIDSDLVYNLERDVRADNGLRVFIYVWVYGDGQKLTGSYGSQSSYDSGWWAGGMFDRNQYLQSSYGISFPNHIRGFQLSVSLR